MAIETLSSGFQSGYSWTVDHDDVAGTIGVTVTGAASTPGQLMLHAQLFRSSDNTLLRTINPIRIDTFAGLGRHILDTTAQLVGVSLVGPSAPFYLSIWTSFGQ